MRSRRVAFLLPLLLAPRIAGAATPTKLYLNFSDGSEGIVLADHDQADHNASQLCSVDKYAVWNGAADCSDRENCRREIVRLVQDYLADFDVNVVLERPTTPYTMMMIGPPSGDCSFGVQGISETDCGNQNPSDIGFAFECSVSTTLCAAVIVHEFGHTIGLEHVSDPSDIMSLGMSDNNEVAFRNRAMGMADEGPCARTSQNSYEEALAQLGPSLDPGPSATPGCAISAQPRLDNPWLFPFAMIASWVFMRRLRFAER